MPQLAGQSLQLTSGALVGPLNSLLGGQSVAGALGAVQILPAYSPGNLSVGITAGALLRGLTVGLSGQLLTAGNRAGGVNAVSGPAFYPFQFVPQDAVQLETTTAIFT